MNALVGVRLVAQRTAGKQRIPASGRSWEPESDHPVDTGLVDATKRAACAAATSRAVERSSMAPRIDEHVIDLRGAREGGQPQGHFGSAA
jgi:hypothetical protein